MDISPKPGPPSNQETDVDVEKSGSVNVAHGDVTNISIYYADSRSGEPSTSRDSHEGEDTSSTQGIGVCDVLILL